MIGSSLQCPSESEVRKLLEEIMPAGKADHPYIYHFDP